MEESLEILGQLADKCDNLIAAAEMPLDPKIHVEQLSNGLRDISSGIKKYVVETGGENPWE